MSKQPAIAKAIEDDFKRRLPLYHKSRREGLVTLAQLMLAADRFYRAVAIIGYCQQAGWPYRIRLKGNLTLSHA